MAPQTGRSWQPYKAGGLKILKALRLVFANQVVGGTLMIALFSVGFSFIVFLLSWLVYRDRYGIALLDYIRLVF